MKKQIHVYFTGRVQGVGFRFTVEDIATSLAVAGWVKNLRDGRVEVIAEAEEEVLQEFLERINQYFSRYIKESYLDWQPAGGEFKDFQIEY
jgi:acylphosphatase